MKFSSLSTVALASTVASLVSAAPSTPVVEKRSLLNLWDQATSTKCPAGYTAGIASDTAYFPIAVSTLLPTVDDFFDTQWEGFTPINTKGKADFPGAQRTFSFGGAVTLTEQLDYVLNTPYYIERKWHGIGGETANSLPVNAEAFGAKVASWTEHYIITPTCGGKSLKFQWDATFCSTNDAVATMLYHQAHTGPFAMLSAKYGNGTSCGWKW